MICGFLPLVASYFSVNGTDNPQGRPVTLARDLFVLADGSATLFLIPDVANVTVPIRDAIVAAHTRTNE
jgi:hypothetical protein